MNDGELSKRIDDVHKRLDDLHRRLDEVINRITRLEDHLVSRLAKVEDRMWWIVGIQIGTWITVMLAILFRR